MQCNYIILKYVIEDTLSDMEIIEMVLEDALIEAGANVDSDEDDEEPPSPIVTIKEAYEALKKLVKFEEQQNEINNCNMDKLKMFRKYLPHYEKLIDKSKIQPKLMVTLLKTTILIIVIIMMLIISLTLTVM